MNEMVGIVRLFMASAIHDVIRRALCLGGCVYNKPPVVAKLLKKSAGKGNLKEP